MADELDSDQIRLLAYLDSLLQGPKQRSLQNKDQEAYMQDVLAKLAAKMEGNLTAEDVEVKLWDMFKSRSKWSKWPEFNIPMLFHHGSSELYLKKETTKLVEEQLRVILLQDALNDTPKSRRSRSAALLPVANSTSNTRSSKRKLGVAKIRSKSSFKKARLTPRSPVGVRQEHTSRSQSEQTITPIPTIEIENTQAIESAGSDIRCETVSAIETRHSHTPAESISQVKSEDTRNLVTPKRFQPTQNAFHKNCCDELLSQSTRYKKRCEDAELQYTDLLNGDRHLESMFARVRNGNRDIDMDMLRELRDATAEIASLKRKLADRTALTPSILTLQDANQPTVARQIHSLLVNLKDGISSVPARSVAQRPRLHKLCEESDDLKDLVRVVSGRIDQQDSPDLNDLTLQELIQALTGASICRWIFESDLHIQSLRVTPLLQRYRDQIGILHGDQVLYALDKSVHQSLIEEHDFTQITIRTVAAKHCQRLVTALRPLYGDEVDSKVIKKLRKRLQSVLQVAVRIRCLSLVSTEEYECIWPLPGSEFDGEEMESHNAEVRDGRSQVKVPVAPGLRAYSKEPGLVSYSGFDTRTGREATSTSVIRAIVLN